MYGWPIHSEEPVAGASFRIARLARPTTAFLAPFLLYRATAAPSVFNLDSAEFTVAVVTGGLVHPTGYPLYLLLGSAWVALPFDDPGRALNLMSSIFGATAILLLDRALHRLGIRASASFFALGLLATGFWYWGMSLIAEVYTLQTTLIASLLLALMHWRRSPTTASSFAVGLTLGLALANHMTSVLLVPACIAFVMASGVRHPPRHWLVAVTGVVTGVAPYLELVRRYRADPVFNYLGSFDSSGRFVAVDLTTLEGFFWLLSGRAFSSLMTGFPPDALFPEVRSAWVETLHGLSGAALGPALVGMAVLWQRDRPLCLWLSLAYLVPLSFFVPFGAADKQAMMIGLWVPLSVASGVGFQRLLDWVSERRRHRPGPAPPAVALTIVGIGCVALSAIIHWPQVDLSMDNSTSLMARSVLAQVPPDALVIGSWDTASILLYLQHVEGERSDVDIINRFHVRATDLQSIIEAERRRRPVLSDRELPLGGSGIEFVADGDWFRVLPPKGSSDPLGEPDG